jgi:hypothetical protein
MNLLPGLLLIIFLSAVVGLGFHLWKGGSIFRMLFLVLFALVGFGIGQWIGVQLNSSFLVIGWVQAGLGTIFSIIFSFVSVWLSKLNLEDIG